MVLNKDFKEFIESLNENIDFIDIDNLRKNKAASARPQDLADLDNLRHR